MPKIIPYGDFKDSDYARIGFKSGLEIHQQLLTEKKLFCRCPAGNYYDEYDAEVLRHMRPTLSELGEYDGTALMEFKTRKEIIYQVNRKNVCTYELDDNPPFELNRQALDIALEVALLLKCNIVGELHIARKQYLDGSIPAGFQRTTILGIDGWIPYKNRRINIIQLGMEEDACREMKDQGHLRVYRTDRLGMPLIESVTYPEMITPVEVAEVGNILRELVRCTGKVRRGIGRARQDVNISITGGTRIEIKGVPRIPDIPALTHYEALRQYNLLEIKEELGKRGISKSSLQAVCTGVSEILRNSAFRPVREAVEKGQKVMAVSLGNFKGLLNYPLQPGRDFAGEISDRVRVIACLDGSPNIIHYEMEDNPLSSNEWNKIYSALEVSRDDAVILVWGDERDTETATREIIIRAGEAAEGIPSETRQAIGNGLTGFERILPGADRMYPDTDMPPVALTEKHVAHITSLLPRTPWERRELYSSIGLHKELIENLVTHKYASLFRNIIEAVPVNPVSVAVLLTQTIKHLKRKGIEVENLSDEFFLKLFFEYSKGTFTRELFPTIVEKAVNDNKTVPLILEELGIYKMSEDELDIMIHKTYRIFKDKKPRDSQKKFTFMMGKIMTEIRGKAEGKLVAQLLAKAMNNSTGEDGGKL